MPTSQPPIEAPSAEASHASLLEFLDASLPTPPTPAGNYVPVVRSGNLLFTSGALPLKEGVLLSTGAVGSYAVPVELGQQAARQCVLNALSVIKAELGSLKRVARVVKVTGFVSAAPGFHEHPAVMNGASDFLVEVFGDRGRHARSAVGVFNLPLAASVEVEMVVEVSPEPTV